MLSDDASLKTAKRGGDSLTSANLTLIGLQDWAAIKAGCEAGVSPGASPLHQLKIGIKS